MKVNAAIVSYGRREYELVYELLGWLKDNKIKYGYIGRGWPLDHGKVKDMNLPEKIEKEVLNALTGLPQYDDTGENRMVCDMSGSRIVPDPEKDEKKREERHVSTKCALFTFSIDDGPDVETYLDNLKIERKFRW